MIASLLSDGATALRRLRVRLFAGVRESRERDRPPRQEEANVEGDADGMGDVGDLANMLPDM